MKNSLALSIAAVVISVVGLAVVLVSSLTPDAPPSSDFDTALSPDGSLLARIEALSDENRALRDRISAIEVRSSLVERTAVDHGFVSKDELDAFRDEVLTALGGPNASANVPSQELEEQVAVSLAEIRRDETVAKLRSGLEKRTASIDRTMPKLTDWLDLTPDQTDPMRAALLAQYEREAEYLRQWESGADETIIGELKASDREALRVELAGFLTPEQLDTYLSRDGGRRK